LIPPCITVTQGDRSDRPTPLADTVSTGTGATRPPGKLSTRRFRALQCGGSKGGRCKDHQATKPAEPEALKRPCSMAAHRRPTPRAQRQGAVRAGTRTSKQRAFSPRRSTTGPVVVKLTFGMTVCCYSRESPENRQETKILINTQSRKSYSSEKLNQLKKKPGKRAER